MTTGVCTFAYECYAPDDSRCLGVPFRAWEQVLPYSLSMVDESRQRCWREQCVDRFDLGREQ